MTLLSRGLSKSPMPVRKQAGSSTGIPIVESGSVQLSDRTYATYATLYQTQVWIYTAVNKYARGIGRLPLKPFERTADDGRERLRDGLLADLMAYPMGWGISPFEWKSAIVGNVGVYGNCVCVLVTASREAPTTEIWPYSPVGWSVKPDTGDYEYRSLSGGDPVTFPRWRIWHPRFWSPTSNGMAISPMEPLRKSIAVEDSASRLSVAMYSNGIRPSGVLMSKQELKDESIKRLAEGFKRLHSGVDNAFKPVVLSGDLTWTPMSGTMVDAAVVEHRKFTREEVAAVYDLPQPSMGILDNANFASIDALHVQLYQDSFGPWTTMIEESFAASVLSGVREYEGQYVEFDINEVMKGDIAGRFTAYQKSLAWMTPNEIRQRENAAPIDDPEADKLHIAGNTAPDAAVGTGSQNVPGQNTSALVPSNGVAHV